MRPTHWLDGVARILRAETDDLRELVRLGGVDPWAAYVGTRLEGVDLSGQDLRGMIFSDLDLSRVRHDAKTLIDPDQVAVRDDYRASIFFTSPAMARDPLFGLLAGYGAKIFHPAEAGEFKASLRPRTPAIVLSWDDEVLAEKTPLDQLGSLGSGLVHIAVGSRPTSLLNQWRELAPGAQVIFCVVPQRVTGALAPRSKPDLQRLFLILIKNWDDLRRRLPQSSLFIRAKSGLEPAPWLDAGAQIFEQIWHLGLQHNLSFVLGRFDHVRERELDGVRKLLAGSRTMEFYDRGSELCAFVDARPGRERKDDRRSFTDAAIDAFQTAQDTRGPEPKIRGTRGQILFLRRASFERHPRSRGSLTQHQVETFDFGNVETIVLTDQAEAAFVAERLIMKRELWITPRDLLGASIWREPTLWTLVASQLRRFVGNSSKGVQSLLRLVVHAAVLKHIDQREALRILEVEGAVIRAGQLEFREGQAMMRVTITAPDNQALFGGIRFIVGFDWEWPRIVDEFAFLSRLRQRADPPKTLPTSGEVERALLMHLLENGAVEARTVYEPLANLFSLSQDQRTTARKYDATPLWNNRVQWARQALKKKGYLDGERGVWALTSGGLEAAREARLSSNEQ